MDLTPYDRLRNCDDTKLIDGLLDEVGLPREPAWKRLLFLYDMMGVKRVFCPAELTLDERYALAKEELVARVWKC